MFLEIFHYIGDLASIITVIGGIFAVCKFCKNRRAKLVIELLERDEQKIFCIKIVNNGGYWARDVRVSIQGIETGAYTDIAPYNSGHLSFAIHESLPTYLVLTWSDGIGRHKKRFSTSKITSRGIFW